MKFLKTPPNLSSVLNIHKKTNPTFTEQYGIGSPQQPTEVSPFLWKVKPDVVSVIPHPGEMNTFSTSIFKIIEPEAGPPFTSYNSSLHTAFV